MIRRYHTRERDDDMDYLSNNVAVNLKRFRQYRGMSLDQMAERTGVSKSMLAQIERGQANPLLVFCPRSQPVSRLNLRI